MVHLTLEPLSNKLFGWIDLSSMPMQEKKMPDNKRDIILSAKLGKCTRVK